MVLLCIDDDPEDVELFIDAVKMIDRTHTCMVAINGIEALSTLANIIPDLIFLDINMPVMDGRETLAKIRSDERLRSVPIFILSTSNDLKEAEACSKLGATKWLVKPSSFTELVRRLKTVFNEDYTSSVN